MRIREVAIGVVSSAVLAGVLAVTIPPPEPVTALAVIRVPAAPAPPARQPVMPRQSVPPGAAPASGTKQPGAAWHELHAKYLHARNLREFFYEVLRSSDHGAFYYAASAFEACERAMEHTPSELPPPRREAAAALQRRCDFTSEGLEDARRELLEVRHIGAHGDPLLDSSAAYHAASGPHARAQVLLEAFEQGHPDVIASLVWPAIDDGMPAALSAHWYSEALRMPYAVALVACRLGSDCGPGAVGTLQLCARQGWCADSIPAAVQQGLGARFAAIDRIVTRVVADIRRRDALRLATPHGVFQAGSTPRPRSAAAGIGAGTGRPRCPSAPRASRLRRCGRGSAR